MASSSDITELKRYLLSLGLCTNCSNPSGPQCAALYQTLQTRFQSGTLTSSQITEIKRLLLSNISCIICTDLQGAPN